MVTRSQAAAAVDFQLRSTYALHCDCCNSALGTRRDDGSVALHFRGAVVIVREGAVVCGVCGANQSICASTPAYSLAFDFALLATQPD